MVRLQEVQQSDCCWVGWSRATYTWFQNHMVRVPEAGQTAAERGKAKLRILNFKITWVRVSEGQLSSLICSEAASGWGLWLLLGTGKYLWVHGCSHLGRCWGCLNWFVILCSKIGKQFWYFVSWSGDNLPINYCKIVLLLLYILSAEMETIC